MKDPQLLVYGSILGQPEERTDINGKAYVATHINCQLDNRTINLFVLSHNPKVSFTLLTLEAGDVVALSGSLAVQKSATGNTNIGIHARRMLSAYPTAKEKPAEEVIENE